ncbi:MAG: RdgB/HAM1 family non-canonical purine NTP pyrophosphatase [Chitinophagales bacterium]
MDLVFATANTHKLQEVRSLLPPQLHVLSLDDIGFTETLPETGETIPENSLEKAEYLFARCRLPCFSEDAGLEIEALQGRPGVHSAHYAGSRDAQENIRKVLEEMRGVENRKARFVAVFTLIIDGKADQFTGIVTGKIAEQPVGGAGFGYDPIFIPDGYTSTFAELGDKVKAAVSHRSRGFHLLISHLENFLHNGG